MLLSLWEVFISLPPNAPIHLLAPPVRLSAHQKIGADSCLCMCVFWCVCVLADVPCSVAHLLNVTDHSLFHLITLTPPTPPLSPNTPPLHLPLLCCIFSCPIYYPPSRPHMDLHDPMHARLRVRTSTRTSSGVRCLFFCTKVAVCTEQSLSITVHCVQS